MSLLGKAAIVISCEIEASLRAEHDAWHSGEHLPERLGIPGFLRGRRCRAVDEAAGWSYFILYELRDAAVMTSSAYLERLNNPTPWSRKVQAACRISRTLCRVVESHGHGVASQVLTSQAPCELEDLLGAPGVTGVHVLERDASLARPRTNEEALRRGGADEAVERVIVVEGHELGAIPLRGERFRLAHVMTPGG